MKNVMTQAWVIAKEAVNKFGGKVKEYFAEALKMAWAQVKAISFDTNSLIAVGKQGDYGFVAIPADTQIERVVDGSNHIIEATEAKGKDGNVYKVYSVLMELNFKIVVNGVYHFFKMMNNGKIFYNGAK